MKRFLLSVATVAGLVLASSQAWSADKLLNASYDVGRELFVQVNKAFIAMRDLFTGIFYVNSSTIGAEVQLPFGGTKQTGNGHREAADTALDIFSEWKAVYVDFSGKLQKAQIDS